MSPPSDHAARSRACQEPENAGRTPAARGVGRWGGVASSTTLDRRASTRPIVFYPFAVLLDGINHVAVLTGDTDRLSRFYTEVFDTPPARTIEHQPGFKLSLIDIGDGRELNVFEIAGNSEANRQTPMFGRGRLDHLGLQAASLEAFEEIRQRLMARGAADGFVTDFGPVLSLFFTDPDGLEGEVLVANPDAIPGLTNPPGTRAERFS